MSTELETRPVSGVALVISSMLIIGLVDNFIRPIAAEAGLWQFLFMRSIAICSMLVALALLFGWRLRPARLRHVALRSLFVSCAMVLYFGAAGMIPVAIAGAGLFTSPIFVLVISALFFGVRIGVWRILAVVVGFSGVLLILKPGGADLSMAVVLPVIGGLFYALAGISTRRWCGDETTATLLLGMFGGLGLTGALGLAVFSFLPIPESWIAAAPFFATGWVAPSAVLIELVAVQAVGSLAAVTLLTRGYQLVDVTFATAGEYSFLIAAAFWGWVLWREVPDLMSVFGAVAIVASGIIILWRSR